MEQPLLKLCIVSPLRISRVVRWRRRRLATVEPTKGFVETRPFGSVARNKKPSRKLGIHEVSQLNVGSEVYDGTDYAVMRVFLNSEDIGVLSSKRFPELVVKQ